MGRASHSRRAADARLRRRSEYGFEVLAEAASHETRLIQQFLQQEIGLDVADGEGNTALHHAAGWGRLENLRLLLAAGADASRRNQEGNTPLDVAEESGRRRVVLLLRSAAAAAAGPVCLPKTSSTFGFK